MSFNAAFGFTKRIGIFAAEADKLSANVFPVATMMESPATPASFRISRFVLYLESPESLTTSYLLIASTAAGTKNSYYFLLSF